jgi:hypothetical protein
MTGSSNDHDVYEPPTVSDLGRLEELTRGAVAGMMEGASSMSA